MLFKVNDSGFLKWSVEMLSPEISGCVWKGEFVAFVDKGVE